MKTLTFHSLLKEACSIAQKVLFEKVVTFAFPRDWIGFLQVFSHPWNVQGSKLIHHCKLLLKSKWVVESGRDAGWWVDENEGSIQNIRLMWDLCKWLIDEQHEGPACMMHLAMKWNSFKVLYLGDYSQYLYILVNQRIIEEMSECGCKKWRRNEFWKKNSRLFWSVEPRKVKIVPPMVEQGGRGCEYTRNFIFKHVFRTYCWRLWWRWL